MNSIPTLLISVVCQFGVFAQTKIMQILQAGHCVRQPIWGLPVRLAKQAILFIRYSKDSYWNRNDKDVPPTFVKLRYG